MRLVRSRKVAIPIVGFTVVLSGLALLPGTSTGARERSAQLPGGPAPATLVGRYRARFTLADLRQAPDQKWTESTASTEELAILNASPGSPRGIGLHTLGGGSPTIPFGVRGNVIFLSCIGANERPTRAVASYRWTRRGKLLTLTKLKDPCRGSYGVNQAFYLTKHVWRKVANR
jgi:hypothetical protein